MSKIKVRDFDKGVEINNTFYPKNYFRILVEDSGVVRISEIENDKSLYIHNWDEFEAIDVNGDPVTIASISDLEDDVLVPFFFRISSGGGTGTGDVVGTTASDVNEIVLYSDATGKKIKTSNVSISTTLGTDDTTVPTSKAVLDAIITQTYTSATIPALQAKQEIDYVIDEFNNTYRYKVLTDTSALETPYSTPAKFLKISPARNVLEGKDVYITADKVATSYTYNAVTYEVSGVKYLATTNMNTSSGGIRIFNTTTKQQIAAIAFNNCKYIVFNPYNNRLYASDGANIINHYTYLGADPKTLTALAVAGTTIVSNTKMIVINQGDYGTLVLATNDDGSLEGGGSPGVPPNITHHVWRLVLTENDDYSSAIYKKLWNRAATYVQDITFETATSKAVFCFAVSNRRALASILIDANLATNSPTLITTLTNNNSYSLTNYNGYAYINGDLGIDKVLISTMIPDSIMYFNTSATTTALKSDTATIRYISTLGKLAMIRYVLHPSLTTLDIGYLYIIDPTSMGNFFVINLYDYGFAILSGIDYVDNTILITNSVDNFIQKLKF